MQAKPLEEVMQDQHALRRLAGASALCVLVVVIALSRAAAEESSFDVRARETEQRMTDDERFALLVSLMPKALDGKRDSRVPADAPAGAGYVAGVPRLGVPALRMSDASLGITDALGARPGDSATAFPAGLALGATFNPALAREQGTLIGREARAKGFNVLLGGGMNLARDPRNGRNFEYISEDPWLSAVMASEAVLGTQSQGVISTVKHFSLNANETNRHWLDAVIDPAAHRESDLLAFQIAIERGQPGSIMCAYNKVNGVYACDSDDLLDRVLKQAWGYKGWVMSDWGAVHDWTASLTGLDQESGAQLDKAFNKEEWFTAPLRAAYAAGKLPKQRVSDMVRRILRSIYAVGADKPAAVPAIDLAKHDATALEVARQGIVLLKNEAALPLTATAKRIAVIGGYAQLGVLSGSGSSLVTPAGGFAANIPLGGEGVMARFRSMPISPSSPLSELRKLLPTATIRYNPGIYLSEATALARQSDIAIVFVVRPESEGFDDADLSIPFGQDALVDAVVAANPNTIVVLQTGNPVAMPWGAKVKAILEAWYPGQAGGQAIAEVLTGKVNPSGRLPMTFPTSLAQSPRPQLAGFGAPFGSPVTVRYDEGAEVGYRWFAKHAKPRYAFGHGLGYTEFSYSKLTVRGGETLTASFTVTNTGARDGADVPQLYLTEAAGDKRVRLLGFERVELHAGESRSITLTADARLLARFDAKEGHWRIAEGTYRVALSKSAVSPVLTGAASLSARLFGN
jgi:beta-glucosidase